MKTRKNLKNISDQMLFRVSVILLLFLVSCRNHSEKKEPVSRITREEMTDVNRYMVTKDRERIESYIERKELKMSESPTGLWYRINKEGEGSRFTDGDRINFNYSCSLLDGSMCYNSDELGPKEIVLGKTTLEAGLNEGLRMLSPGADALFILPPFMAFGLIGDGKKIPSRAILVYNVTILPAR
jgi:FKBP-type peptidyl-prolyl cis-trans isomerase FkpA